MYVIRASTTASAGDFVRGDLRLDPRRNVFDHAGTSGFPGLLGRQKLLQAKGLFEDEKYRRFRVFPNEGAYRFLVQFPDALQDFLEYLLSGLPVSVYITTINIIDSEVTKM